MYIWEKRWALTGSNNVNVYIFVCIHFREFEKIGNVAWILMRVFNINGYIWQDIFIHLFDKHK